MLSAVQRTNSWHAELVSHIEQLLARKSLLILLKVGTTIANAPARRVRFGVQCHLNDEH